MTDAMFRRYEQEEARRDAERDAHDAEVLRRVSARNFRHTPTDEGRMTGSPAVVVLVGAGLVIGLLAFPAFRFAAQTIVAASELLHEVQQLRIEQ